MPYDSNPPNPPKFCALREANWLATLKGELCLSVEESELDAVAAALPAAEFVAVAAPNNELGRIDG